VLGGDFAKGAEKLVPVKVLTDAIGAYRRNTEGIKTGSGWQVMAPKEFGLVQGLTQTFGFRSAKEAEVREARSWFFQAQKSFRAERNELERDYANASGTERSRVWLDIVEWNRDHAPEERLSRADLNSYAKKHAHDNQVRGIRMDKPSRHLFRQMQGAYEASFPQ
jgi:hypothetical protein